MTVLRRRILDSLWLRAALGTIATTALVLHLDPGSRMQAWTPELAAGPALAGFLVTAALITLRAWRWNLILGAGGAALPAGELARIYGASFFLGLVSPGKLGELSRVWMIRHRQPDLGVAALSVVFDRAFDLVPCLLVIGLFGALATVTDSGIVDAIRITFVVFAGVLIALLLRPGWLQRRVAIAAARLQARSANGAARPVPVVDSRFSRRTLVAATGLSILSQALAILQVWLFARAAQVEIDALSVYAVVTMATVVASLPLSVAGIGTREAAVVLALGALGVPIANAMGFSLFWLINFLAMLAATFVLFLLRPRVPPQASAPNGTQPYLEKQGPE
ncbi:hypothetical protein GCM10011521_20130 [Arenimonas soli]|uniref:TIGR00374 family protein n=1 Tax=Arenimonas soli TaxID=2269504 RepID=A0ABQ1HKV0_9GAMM|nr:lysylphosphatidylglycerol synthase transmembrane domain-containing protein [Arenimonas soli]GGA81766.1 hypothetical protein GCM10011521_20130 [Arenimonas soli]